MLDFDPNINSARFIADFLVTHMRPNIEQMKTKIKGIVATRMRLFPPDEVPDLLSFTKKSQLAIIDSLPALPSWFDKNCYIDITQRKIQEYLGNNKELSKAVKEIENHQPDFEDAEAIKLFRNAVVLLGDKMQSWFNGFETYSAKLMIDSDIPVDYFLVSKESQLAQMSVFQLYSKGIGRLDAKLSIQSRARNFTKFSGSAAEFKRNVSPLLALDRALTDSLSRINLYLDMQNSFKMDEMFQYVPYRNDLMSMDLFKQYVRELEIALSALNDELISRQGYVHEPLTLSENTKLLSEDLANVVIA